MKTRVITGVVAAALFLALLIQPWTPAVTILMAALSAVAVYELLYVTGYMREPAVLALSMAFAAFVPFWPYAGETVVLTVIAGYATAVGVHAAPPAARMTVQDTAYAVLLTSLSSLALASIAYVRELPEHGLILVILVLLIPWISDTGAYFTGTLCGKHKLCPKISPKKTVEGLIGGIVLSVAVDVLTAWLYTRYSPDGAAINLWLVMAMALIGAPLSVFGDLFASIIKRQCGIKDYGNLFPGHGGVMDRFDSFLFVSPLAYLAITSLPFVA